VHKMRIWKNRSRAITLAAVFLFVVVAGFGGLGLTEAASEPPAKVGSKEAVAPTQALPLLVDVGADKCIPCKMMAPILEELKKDYSQSVKIEFVDVWKNPAAGKPYRVRMIPTQIFYDASGKEFFRHEGFYSKEDILGKFKDLDIELKRDADLGSPAPAKKAPPAAKGAKR
jgi:thioredoxin 1